MLEQNIDALSSRLSDMCPEVIVIVLKKISGLVREAVARPGLHVPIYELPFPGSGHQNSYIKSLTEILRTHIINEK